MQFSAIFTVLACSALTRAAIQGNVTSGGNQTWVTDIVTAYTTFCPASTTFEAYGSTYTVTEATTLTLPCPCTSSYAVASSVPTVPAVYTSAIPTVNAPAYLNTTKPAVATNSASTAPVAVGTGEATTPAATTPPAVSTTSSTMFTGAATRNNAIGGLVGVAAMAAFVL